MQAFFMNTPGFFSQGVSIILDFGFTGNKLTTQTQRNQK
jgi:hypothetical protein